MNEQHQQQNQHYQQQQQTPTHRGPQRTDAVSMKYCINHVTTYSGREPISVGHNQAWLRPRNLPYQTCESYELKLTPEPSVLSFREDTFGNEVATFSFNEGYPELTIAARSVVKVHRQSPAIEAIGEWSSLRHQLEQHRTPVELATWHFRGDSPLAYCFDDAEMYARESFPDGCRLGVAAVDLMRRVHADFVFDPHATTVSTPVTEVFEKRKGVCQDFAHVMLSMFRSIGVAARYVSGYLRTYPKPGQPRLVGADASHAWVSIYGGPEFGWIDLDPTNNLVVKNEHVTIAWGRDYSDIPPLRGVFLGGGQLDLHVSVDVEPLPLPHK
ncbi:MAG: transglutaminase family protein [Planctomycetaceae bacterium]